jgi:predicted small lipoprotein YifL
VRGALRMLLAGALLWLAACGHVGPLTPPDGGKNGSEAPVNGSGY